MCFGPFTRICHWGPLTALGIIKFVTGMTMHCNNMLWPAHTPGGFLNSALFVTLAGLTLYNFLSAVYHGPGFLPLGWKPVKEEDCEFLQSCGVCHGYKAPRSHHCRKCGRCVMKMDHHCPWINNCVGWGNHAHFTLFLLFATLGCLQASIILGRSLYKAIHRLHFMYHGPRSEPVVNFGLYGVIMVVLALGLAIGVVIAVGMLFYFQLRAIIRNRTGIEDWILEKAKFRRRNSDEKFVFPYDLGPWKNTFQVFNFTCHPIGDGVTWPVAKQCNQYTLTKEQIIQKSEKRLKTKIYSIVRPASGYWFPTKHGFKVCINFPFTDEPRIKLAIGDTVLVTRWRKYWLFGEKIQHNVPTGEESLRRTRGWFPRRCAVELIENNDDGNFSPHSLHQSITEKKIE